MGRSFFPIFVPFLPREEKEAHKKGNKTFFFLKKSFRRIIVFRRGAAPKSLRNVFAPFPGTPEK